MWIKLEVRMIKSKLHRPFISLGVVCLHCTLTTTQMATNSWYFILSLISRLYYGDIYGYEYSLQSYVYFCDCRRIHTHTHCQLCNNTTTKVSLLIPPQSPLKSFIFKNWMKSTPKSESLVNLLILTCGSWDPHSWGSGTRLACTALLQYIGYTLLAGCQ